MKRYWVLALGCWLTAVDMQADEVMKIDASKVQQITFSGNAPANKLFDLVKVQKKCDGAPRKFEDYEVTLDKANLPNGVAIEEMI